MACLAGVAFAVPQLVLAATVSVDVSEWAAVGSGVTADGWSVEGLDSYADGSVRFNAKADFALSPNFATVITQVTMRVKSSSPEATRFLEITPSDSAHATVHRAAPTEKDHLTEENFCWDPSEGVHGFRLQIEGAGTAGWGISALAIHTVDVATPTGLRDNPLYRDAFQASWDGVKDAKLYQVRCAQVVTTPPRYETLAEWCFSALTNTSGSTCGLEKLQGEFPGLLGDLSGTNVCMQAYESGHLQIGKGESLGMLALPCQLAGDDLTGILCAWKYPDDAKTTMPLFAVSDGQTNDLATIELTKDRAEYRFRLPDGFAADCILLSSATNGLALKNKNGRVRVASFAIVSGYTPISVVTNDFVAVGTPKAERIIKNLVPGDWVWSVRAFDAKGNDSPWSAFRTVTLDATSPSRPPSGLGVFLR